jgi:phosphohistidine swiveling domain-containing protein
MLGLVGGKAANLGELIRGGFAVPPGFCLTTDAYASAVAAAGDRGRLATVPVPDEIADAVIRAYRALGPDSGLDAVDASGPDAVVAVRSSATAEDLPHASFAGQQDTFLNVSGEDAVLDAVRRCWASLWSERAISYRERNRIDHDAVRLAVVIQQMVDAAVAGVLFTANPVTGRRRQAVIDASPGLGEAVVSGSVNPDQFTVDPDGRIAERHITHDRPSLTDEQVLALAVRGQRAEAYFGAPQDIEWAIDRAGRIWLTQARAITSLYPLPEGATEDPLRAYFSVNVVQGVYRPLTPMGLSMFHLMASAMARLAGHGPPDPLAGPPSLADAGGRLFVDLAPMLRSGFARSLLNEGLARGEARTGAALGPLLQDPRIPVVPGATGRFLRGLARFMVRSGAPVTIVRALVNPAKFRESVALLPEQVRAAAAAARASEDPVTALARLVLEQQPRAFVKVAPAIVMGGALYEGVSRLLDDLATPDEVQTVLRSLPHNVTTEMDLELWALARRVREGRLTLDDALHEFLQQYGHRGVAEIDIGLPRWREDPAHIRGVLANYLRLDDPEREPGVLFERGRQAAEAMVAELTRRARARNRLLGAVVGFCLKRVRTLNGLREMPKFLIVLLLGEVRTMLQAIGENLAKEDRLDDPDDVFFLRLAELREPGDLHERVAERRAEYDRELLRRHLPRILLSDGTEPERALLPAASDQAITGTPASAGTATGPARVILDPVGAVLEPGEILVAPSTDPGWTPLFLTAGALVMEMGGAMSHGAVVAREYGIPAVVGAAGATDRIVSGQQVTVDGSAGTVRAA